MNLVFRLIYLMLTYRFKKQVPALGPCETSFHCWPTDIDVLMHMNNGKYCSLMDLGRVDLMARSGLLKEFTNRGWYPVVVAETIRFKKSIMPFEKFKIETKIVGWEEKTILLGQKFIRNEVVVCEAVVKGRFLKKTGGSVPVAELLGVAGVSTESPEMEPWVAEWNAAQS